MSKPLSPNLKRFKPIGKRLVVSTRIALDPQADADIIQLLQDSKGMADLIRSALRVCYQPGTQGKGTVKLLEGHTGVRLAASNGESIDIFLPDLPNVVRQLLLAQTQLTGGAVVLPEGVTIPLSMTTKHAAKIIREAKSS